MVEAREEPEVQVNQEAVRINICGVEKANALGLFREQELNTHVDVVLAQYIRVVQDVAQVRRLSHCNTANGEHLDG